MEAHWHSSKVEDSRFFENILKKHHLGRSEPVLSHSRLFFQNFPNRFFLKMVNHVLMRLRKPASMVAMLSL